MLLRRSLRYALLVIVVLLVALVAYGAWLAYKVDKSLTAAENDATALKSAALSGDAHGITSALAALRVDSASARQHTGSWVWSLGTHVPVYGKDLRGIRVASDVADDLSHGGLAQLVTSMTRLPALLPHKGRFDVATIKSLQRPVATGAAALKRAQAQLDAQDPSGYVERLKEKYRTLQSEVDSAASAMGSADVAAQVLPSMLGGDGPQHYLVLFENNAEIRGSGGLAGQASYVTADRGRIQLSRQVDGALPALNTTTSAPIPAAQRKIWSGLLGHYFLDANFTPDFPMAARLWAAHWQKAFGQHVDGVVALDPVTISYLLDATGPITVDGVRLTGDNAVDYLLHEVYIDKPNPAAEDVFFHDVAQAALAQFSNSSASPQALIGALLKGADERRLFIHSFDPAVQAKLQGTEVDGAVDAKPTTDPQVVVAVNDLTAAKMSYYLRYNVAVRSTYCTSDAQGLSGQATFSSTAPADAGRTLPVYVTGGGNSGVTPGEQYDQMTLFGPVGGTITNVLVNGKPDPVDVWHYKDGDRSAIQIGMLIKPQGQVNLSWNMTTGKGQTGDTDVDVTPSVVAGSSSSVASSACG